MKKKILKILFGTENIFSIIPGTLLAGAVMLSAKILSFYLGALFKSLFNVSGNLVSMFLLAIILGMAVRNIFPLPRIFEPGINFCLKKLLRLGIMFLGIRLSIMAVARIGAVALVIATLCVATGIVVTYYLAKPAGVDSRLGTLIAAGTGICGVSAVVAVSPCIGAKEEETAYAISVITIFGLFATLVYPYAIEMVLNFNQAQAGLFLGTAVHDTSQVTGAAFIYDQMWATDVSKIAITTKLIRNMLMVVVIPVLSLVYTRKQDTISCVEQCSWWSYFPKFVIGFLVFAILRSVGDIFTQRGSGFLFWTSVESWSGFYLWIKSAAGYILAAAISAAGLATQFSKLKKLSYKPFLIGFGAAVIVAGVSFILVTLFKGPISSMITTIK